MAAVRADDFLWRANGRGLAAGDQASSRTYPDEAERQTDIYGSDGHLRISPWYRWRGAVPA
jgi:hypothetical protein